MCLQPWLGGKDSHLKGVLRILQFLPGFPQLPIPSTNRWDGFFVYTIVPGLLMNLSTVSLCLRPPTVEPPHLGCSFACEVLTHAMWPGWDPCFFFLISYLSAIDSLCLISWPTLNTSWGWGTWEGVPGSCGIPRVLWTWTWTVKRTSHLEESPDPYRFPAPAVVKFKALPGVLDCSMDLAAFCHIYNN